MSLSPSYKLPGIYLEEIFGSDTGSVTPNTRAVFFGYVTSSATRPLNTPFIPGSLAEVIQTCGGKKAMLTHVYQAAKSQGAGAEIVLVPLAEPSGGTAATHKIIFLPAPSAGVNGTNVGATTPDTCTILVRGRGGSFRIAAGDTFATIATNAKAMLDGVGDLPVSVSISTETLTLTDPHKGEHGNVCPVSVSFSSKGASGVAASPGDFTFTTTATGIGTATIGLDARSTTATIGATNTVVQSAQAVLAAIRADGYCVDAGLDGTPTGTVTLYYRNDMVAHRLTISSTAATQTVSAAGCGTVGSGVPTLTSALAKLRADKRANKVYCAFWEDTASWTALSAHIESEAVVPVQKGQVVVAVSTTRGTSVRSANLPDATTPKLTSSPRYLLGWQQGSPQAGWELAARIAAEIAAAPFQAQNFNGLQLKTADGIPLGVPHPADRVEDEENNTMIATYKYAPLVVDSSGRNALARSSTTYLSTSSLDAKLEKISAIIACDYMRDDIRAALKAKFGKSSIKAKGTPRTSKAVSPLSIRDEIYIRLLSYDAQDLFDDAKSLRDAIQVKVPTANRASVVVPLRPVADLDQIDIESPII